MQLSAISSKGWHQETRVGGGALVTDDNAVRRYNILKHSTTPAALKGAHLIVMKSARHLY